MTKTQTAEIKDILTDPVEIVKKLDEFIVGQHEAKKVLAVALLNRGLRQLNKWDVIKLDVNIEKSNVLLVGPTGTGKTALLRAVSEIADLPVSIFDITSITSAGYIGNKVEDILLNHLITCENYVYNNYDTLIGDTEYSSLYTKSDMIKDYVESSIIYIDEFDKIRMDKGVSGRDVNGRAVQSELLKIIENGTVHLAQSRTEMRSSTNIKQVDTKDILYVCGGAFSGLDEIIERRLNKTNAVGFTSEINETKELKETGEIFTFLNNDDLIEYGVMPELLGRLPLKTSLSPLSKEMLCKIITEPKDSIFEQYKAMFEVFGITLSIDKSGMETIAQQALDLKIGARSLKTLFSQLLTDNLYNIFSYKSKKLVINRDLVLTKEIK